MSSNYTLNSPCFLLVFPERDGASTSVMSNSNRSKIDMGVFSLIVGLCTLVEEFSLCVCVFTKMERFNTFKGKNMNFKQRINIICSVFFSETVKTS